MIIINNQIYLKHNKIIFIYIYIYVNISNDNDYNNDNEIVYDTIDDSLYG